MSTISVRAHMAQATPSVQSSQLLGCHPLLVPLQPHAADSYTRCGASLGGEFDICGSAHVGSNRCCCNVDTTGLKGPSSQCWPLGTHGIMCDGRNCNMCTACIPNPPCGVGDAFPVLPCHACEKQSWRIIVGAGRSGMSCMHPRNECQGNQLVPHLIFDPSGTCTRPCRACVCDSPDAYACPCSTCGVIWPGPAI